MHHIWEALVGEGRETRIGRWGGESCSLARPTTQSEAYRGETLYSAANEKANGWPEITRTNGSVAAGPSRPSPRREGDDSHLRLGVSGRVVAPDYRHSGIARTEKVWQSRE